MQASRFERLSFDPFTLFQDDFVTPEVHVGGCDVVDDLVIALMIVVMDEGFDLVFKVTWQEVVLERDAVLEGLMPTFDLALGSDQLRRFRPLLINPPRSVHFFSGH